MSAASIQHPAISDLTEYCDGMASVELTDKIEAHMNNCSPCALKMVHLVRALVASKS
jgi:hypothetical protein